MPPTLQEAVAAAPRTMPDKDTYRFNLAMLRRHPQQSVFVFGGVIDIDATTKQIQSVHISSLRGRHERPIRRVGHGATR